MAAEAFERLDEIEGLTDEGRVRLAEFRSELDELRVAARRPVGEFLAEIIRRTGLLAELDSAADQPMALARRRVRSATTWDCGYASPTPRMQYTASSFAQPLTESFGLLLQTRKVLTGLEGLFPQRAEFHSHTDDPYRRYIFQPLFQSISRAMSILRPLQQGKVQLYVLYIAVILLVLLLWQIA